MRCTRTYKLRTWLPLRAPVRKVITPIKEETTRLKLRSQSGWRMFLSAVILCLVGFVSTTMAGGDAEDLRREAVDAHAHGHGDDGYATDHLIVKFKAEASPHAMASVHAELG